METPGNNSMDWQSFVRAWSDLDEEQRTYFLERLNASESFIPLSVDKFEFKDLEDIDRLIAQLQAEVQEGMPSYTPFINLLKKIKVLVIEHHPEFFDQLSEQGKKELVGSKLDFPTELEVDDNIFALLDGRVQLQSLSTSFTFDEKVATMLEDPKLSKKLSEVYYQYKEYFQKQHGSAA